MTLLDHHPGRATESRRPDEAPGAATAPRRTGDAPARTSRVLPVLLPALLTAALGLAIQCLGYAAGWLQSGGYVVRVLGIPVEQLTIWSFYVGLVLVALPFVLLLTRRHLTRRQRIWGTVTYTHLMYLSWWALTPLIGIHFDENLRVTNEVALLGGEDFFTSNSMLPVSPFYPGLELVSTGVHWLTGLPLAACHVVTVVLARTVLVVAFFAIVERITRSHHAASIAVVLYAANPQFYFFDAQFNYDTLAVALSVLAVWTVLRLEDLSGRARIAGWATVLAALGALTVTHHLGDWMTCGLLWAWSILHLLGRDPRRAGRVAVAALVGTGLALAWATLASGWLRDYLEPLFGRSWTQILSAGGGGGGGRQLFQDNAGEGSTPFQRFLLLGSSVTWCLLLVAPAWLVWRRRLLDHGKLRLLPWAVGSVYPLLLLVRVSPNAAEIAVRASAYVMLATALLVAAWLARGPLAREVTGRAGRATRTVVVGATGLLLTLGGVVLGAGPDWEHQAGPFASAAQHRSVDKNTLAVAHWAQRHMPEGSRVAGDTTTNRLLPNYAPVVPVTYIGGMVNVSSLFMADAIGPEQADLLDEGEIDFVVVDTRLADTLSPNGSIYEPSDTWDSSVAPATSEQLDKFATTPGFDLVVDQGPVLVYDVRSLRGEPRTFAEREARALPGPWTPVRAGATLLGLLLAGAVTWWLVRRRARSRDSLPGASLGAVTVGGLMLTAGAGHTLGWPPLVGSAVLATSVLVSAVWVVRARRGPRAARGRWTTALGAVVALMLVVGGVGAASLGQWRGLVSAAPVLPAPGLSGSPAAPDEGVSTIEDAGSLGSGTLPSGGRVGRRDSRPPGAGAGTPGPGSTPPRQSGNTGQSTPEPAPPGQPKPKPTPDKGR